MYTCLHMWWGGSWIWLSLCVKVREQLSGYSSVLPLCVLCSSGCCVKYFYPLCCLTGLTPSLPPPFTLFLHHFLPPFFLHSFLAFFSPSISFSFVLFLSLLFFLPSLFIYLFIYWDKISIQALAGFEKFILCSPVLPLTYGFPPVSSVRVLGVNLTKLLSFKYAGLANTINTWDKSVDLLPFPQTQ